MAREWKPVCHGLQWAAWKDACQACPFWSTCKDGTTDMKRRNDDWRKRDVEQLKRWGL